MKTAITAVIIPAWKAGWCLERCLVSISKQTVLPDEILIGIDNCKNTMESISKIPDSLKSIIKVYWFFEHSGCYLIRNTLINKCDSDFVILFDADDEMRLLHVETMQKTIRPSMIIRPYCATYTNRSTFKKYRNPHGAVAFYKDLFMELNGFEAWECAADLEFIERAERSGAYQKFLKKVTMNVYKHKYNLTRMKTTGGRSRLRQELGREIAKRRKYPVSKVKLETARCIKFSDYFLSQFDK